MTKPKAKKTKAQLAQELRAREALFVAEIVKGQSGTQFHPQFRATLWPDSQTQRDRGDHSLPFRLLLFSERWHTPSIVTNLKAPLSTGTSSGMSSM